MWTGDAMEEGLPQGGAAGALGRRWTTRARRMSTPEVQPPRQVRGFGAGQ